MNAPTPEQIDRKALEQAVGYEPVPLSIRNHPAIRFEYRTVADRDGLVERILAAGFTQGTVPAADVEPHHGSIARLKVQRGDLTEWPLAERVKNGWQNGVTFYPDADVVSATLLQVKWPDA